MNRRELSTRNRFERSPDPSRGIPEPRSRSLTAGRLTVAGTTLRVSFHHTRSTTGFAGHFSALAPSLLRAAPDAERTRPTLPASWPRAVFGETANSLSVQSRRSSSRRTSRRLHSRADAPCGRQFPRFESCNPNRRVVNINDDRAVAQIQSDVDALPIGGDAPQDEIVTTIGES